MAGNVTVHIQFSNTCFKAVTKGLHVNLICHPIHLYDWFFLSCGLVNSLCFILIVLGAERYEINTLGVSLCYIISNASLCYV